MRRRYTPRRTASDLSNDPICIGCDTIVQYLEQMDCPRMAEFARRFARMGDEHAKERLAWQAREAELIARLHKYEPPAPSYEPHNPRPPAEASD